MTIGGRGFSTITPAQALPLKFLAERTRRQRRCIQQRV